MSDKPTEEHKTKAEMIQVLLRDAIQMMENMEEDCVKIGHKNDYPDLRHAKSKIFSASRGLDDFISKAKGTYPYATNY